MLGRVYGLMAAGQGYSSHQKNTALCLLNWPALVRPGLHCIAGCAGMYAACNFASWRRLIAGLYPVINLHEGMCCIDLVACVRARSVLGTGQAVAGAVSQAAEKLGEGGIFGQGAEAEAAQAAAEMKRREKEGVAPSMSLAAKDDVMEQASMAGDADWACVPFYSSCTRPACLVCYRVLRMLACMRPAACRCSRDFC